MRSPGSVGAGSNFHIVKLRQIRSNGRLSEQELHDLAEDRLTYIRQVVRI